MKKVIAVDLDRTLTIGDDEFKRRDYKPNKEMIEWVNNEYKKTHVILIHTARKWDNAKEVAGWLTTNGVYYHGLRMEKPYADVYVDDKALNVRDVK